MRNLLIFVFIFILAVGGEAQVQSQIKVEQYKIIVDRTITRVNGNCFQYEASLSPTPNPNNFGCLTTFTCTFFPVLNCTNLYKCIILDPDCTVCPTTDDAYSVQFYRNGIHQPNLTISNPSLDLLPVGVPQNFSDTSFLYTSP
jgi:hypothetical protein